MKLFNNLSRKLEEFKPIQTPFVNIYSCGPTVYDDSHIGHARSCIVWDLLYRYLKFKNYKVTWLRNITNVDDKIVARAKLMNVSPDQLSRAYTYEFWKDMVALNISWPDLEPRATDYLSEMFDFVQGLIDKKLAYEINGDVYFRVSKAKNYGQLKGLNIEQLRDGLARVEENSKKEDQLDFALWKAFPDDTSSSFQSPWGLGRPGWHLECSTMIKAFLNRNGFGDTLDIHAGGDDLIFPHHENECAQSESLTDKALAKYWLHNGMVMVNGSKMSKSEGNFFTIKDLLKKYKANSIRYFCFSTHYKKQINFSDEALTAAETGFEKLFALVKSELENIRSQQNITKHFSQIKFEQNKLNNELVNKFTNAMDDDLSSPQALALLFEHKNPGDAYTILYLLNLLGFDLNLNLDSSQNSEIEKYQTALTTLVQKLLEEREQARINKDFASSDRVRNQLQEAGVIIKDFRDKPSDWSLAN